MKNTLTIAALAMSVASSFAGSAPMPAPAKGPVAAPASDLCGGPISYSSARLDYLHTWFDMDGIDDGNGLDVVLEYSPFQNVYLSASGSYLDVGGIDAFGVTAGIGGYVPLTDNLHLAADAGVIYSDVEDNSDTGWYARPHLRAKVSCFEIHAGAKYICMDSQGDWEGFADTFYQVATGIDLALGVAFNEDATTLAAGVRFRF